MKNNYWIILLLLFSVGIGKPLPAQEIYDLESPNGKILAHIRFSDKIDFEVLYGSKPIVGYSTVAMNVGEGFVLGKNPKTTKKITNSVDRELHPVVPLKSKTIRDNFNEASFKCKGKYNIVFRVYDNGVAWRFETSFKDNVRVNSETLNLVFPENSKIWFPEEEHFVSHNERYYLHEPLDSISKERFCSLPALVESADNIKVLITETDLEDYPGMWLKGTGGNSLNAIFPKVALEVNMTNDRNPDIVKRTDYIAQTNGSRTFPWRILAIAENDADLITSQLSYQLAKPSIIEDPSWIKPGKVSWDWWNAWNVYGVDFKAGINTETYKYYIDFASAHGIEYIIMDEGWYVLGGLMDVVPEIDMEEIISYANEKNVDVILWVIWKTLEDQWEEAFDQFEKWGIKGLKVDFMQRDDQWMVDYYQRVAKEAAKRKMLVDFHGAYKPAGLRRKYPNVINREGLRGLEQNKWSKTQTPEHDVTLPFIRMVAGPMDYTPGAMVNAQSDNFRAIWNRPMSMGTRCHQMAMYVVFESPLQMLADNPSNYYREAECMEFLSVVPTVWDTTIVLSAKIADHILIARKKGNDWFVGAMTNGKPKDLEVDFSFLGTGNYKIDIWQDGINADRYASDYKKLSEDILAKDKMKIHLAPGGGWVARIY